LSAFGGLASGQKFLPPDPLPFCPPAWASPRFFLAGNYYLYLAALVPRRPTRATQRNSLDDFYGQKELNCVLC